MGLKKHQRTISVSGQTTKTDMPAKFTEATGGYRRIRRLTPQECERLQGFPDNWTEGISDTQRYKCLGNAVTVNVIEAIGRALQESGQDGDTF